MVKLRPRLSVLVLFSLLTLGLTAAAPVAAADPVTAIVELQRAPLGPAAAKAERNGASFDQGAYQALLLQEHQAFLDTLASLGIEASVQSVEAVLNDAQSTTVRAEFTYAFNGLGLTVDPAHVPTIASLPDVRAVHPDRPVQALLDVSVDHINAPKAWNDLGSRGEGQTVAVIDTGIDWTHPMFGGDPVTPPGELHPKVKFYMTFTAGGPDGHGHGTHVSGIAVGDRDFGETLNGPALFNGVGPKADLWGYKVLTDAGSGSSLSVILAIEDAAVRGADVINLSLGDSSGDPDSASSQAVNGANDSGVAVAVAAGNDGPGYSTIGSPAAAHKAITLGASTDPGDNEYFARLQVSPVEDMQIIPLAGSPVPEQNQQALYADCGQGTTVADCPLGTAGKIALIERGTSTFTQKALSAEAAGAIAAVIYNNVPGNFAGTLIILEPNIPVVAMSQADGQRLKELVDPVTRISSAELLLDWQNFNVISDQVAGFSSRGPNNDFVIKPDIVAPGNNITSSVPPVGQLASPDRYAPAGGTSMASPHGAGALAVMRDLHPDWAPEWLKSALMNTAIQLSDPVDGQLYSVHDQGAGRIDVYLASTTPALVGETYPDGRLARGSVNFGEVRTSGGQVQVEKTIVVQDVSGGGGTWNLSFEPGDGKDRGGEGRTLPANGFSLKITPSSVRLAANGSATATVQVSLDGRVLLGGDYEGRIVASGPGTLRAPLYVRVDSDAKFGSNAPELQDPGDVNTSGDYRLEWSAVEGADKYRLQEADTFTNHFVDDAESDGSQWESSGWTQSPLRFHSPDQSYFSGQGPELNNTLTTAEEVQLPGGSGVTLSYWTFFSIEDGFDFGYVEASADGGTSWKIVDQVNGSSGGWVKRTPDLSAFAGESVLLRFRYQTDTFVDLVLFEGWYVDDISVDSANWATIAEVGATHHNVTDQPSGTYAYRVAALFSDRGFGRQLQGPWSNVVDITVER